MTVDAGPIFDDLTGYRRDLLWTVHHLGSPCGLSIREALEGYYGRALAHSIVYKNLNWLEQRDFVSKRERDGCENVYSLTEKARRTLTARQVWLENGPDATNGGPRALPDGGRSESRHIGTVSTVQTNQDGSILLEASGGAVEFRFFSPELARAMAESILPAGYAVVEEDRR